MSNTVQLLRGQVRLRPLLVTDRPAERSEVQARLLSPGGELAVLADGVTPIGHLNYVELRAGKSRGNHYHNLRHESFYVIAGELTVHLQDIVTGERAETKMVAGNLIQIDPNIAHVFLPTGDGHALEFAPEPFDSTDVVRHVVA